MNNEDRFAQFYNICNLINPEYGEKGYVTDDMLDGFEERIKDHIDLYKIKFGDILFVGSEYETRQHYGFRIVLEDGTTESSENGYTLVFEKGLDKKLKNNNVKYCELFQNIKSWPLCEELWLSNYYEDEVVADYVESGIWD